MNKYREKFKEKVSAVSEKTHIDKKLFPIIALAFAGILLLLISEIPLGSKDEETTAVQSTKAYDSAVYVNSLEERMTQIISSIEGAGRTKVMITLESSDEEIYLRDSSVNSDSDANSVISRNEENKYIIISGESGENGIVAKTVEPKVRGVAVVCEGASSSPVKQEIINTVSALLNISSARISVAQMG